MYIIRRHASGGINTRTFEILAAGGFELVDKVPGLAEHFEVGREIVAYASPAEFRELTEYYLSHPSERAAIVERGRSRVLRDHTYEKRLEVILKTLEVPIKLKSLVGSQEPGRQQKCRNNHIWEFIATQLAQKCRLGD